MEARRGARGKRPEPNDDGPLSRERIVLAAIEILDGDGDGAGGLTMRRLADRLGCGVMSLYWHVENKEVVLGLALDAVVAYRAPATAPHRWRDEIVVLMEDWRACMLRHPWAAPLLPQHELGPNILARLELLSVALSKGGVAETDLNAAIWSLWNHAIGAATSRVSFDLKDCGDSREDTGLPSGRYPSIERSRLVEDDDWDGVFRKGLGFLLDGLSRR